VQWLALGDTIEEDLLQSAGVYKEEEEWATGRNF
jgi:hypothetical protein